MKDKIIQIANAMTVVHQKSPSGIQINGQVLIAVHGLGESGIVYELRDQKWVKVIESPERTTHE